MQAPRKRAPGSRMQPTTEEQRESRPRPRVCRRLFADDVDPNDPVDHSVRDNMLNQINEQINRDLDEACKKYNFDFRNEVPLEGDWEWERIGEPEAEPHLRRVGDQEGTPRTTSTPTAEPPQTAPDQTGTVTPGRL